MVMILMGMMALLIAVALCGFIKQLCFFIAQMKVLFLAELLLCAVCCAVVDEVVIV
jgi:hypothetical protein